MSTQTQDNNRRIAKNTLMLYLRMFLTMVVGVYTSRVVLQTLGVEDYGIYGVVGGIVSMMGFLNASMSGATSRFLTFELGRGNKERLKKTFSSALIVHIIIAAIVFVVAETIGLWFLCNKLVIPEGRMAAAHWVYQLSILSSMLTITQVPYNSSIIAHEKMDVYAYVEILNVSLKLLIVYLLLIGNFDKLILYSILTFAVSVIIMMVYRIYCLRKFEECRFHWIWDKEYLKPLLSFSGWDLFGNMAVTTRQQGTNFLINMFFGVVYNAASGVASTVNGMLGMFSHNVLTAFRPQIIKLYSTGNFQESVNILYNAGKFATLLMVLIVIPFSFEMEYIMKLWLGNPPDYAVLFCRIMMIASCINMCECTLNIGINATAQMRQMSIFTGVCYLGVLPIIYVFYRFGLSVEIAYYMSYVVCTINLLIRIYILKQKISTFSLRYFAFKVIVPVVIIAIITTLVTYVIHGLFEQGFLRLILVFMAVILVGCLLTMAIALNKEQRIKCKTIIQEKITIWNNFKLKS